MVNIVAETLVATTITIADNLSPMNRMTKLLNAVCFLGLVSCVGPNHDTLPHKGTKNISATISELDSIDIDAIDTSTRGNLVLLGDTLYFADMRYCALHKYDLSGKYLGKKLGEGNGPNELPNLLYASTLSNNNDTIVLIDSSVRMYLYDVSKDSLNNLGNVDFGWGTGDQNYDSPGVYNIMQMTDFGTTFTKMDDGKIIFPVSIIRRFVGDEIDKERYEKGHTLGMLDPASMKVGKVFGKFAPFMLENPTPGFEFFDYAYNDADHKYYISFATDPKLYCMNESGEMEYSFGEDPQDVKRTYTIGYNDPYETFKEDIKDGQIGCNTGVVYVKDKNLVLRTTLLDFASGRVALQAYRDNDLIFEKEMPPYFKLLGYTNGYFIGCRFLPVEKDEDNVAFRIYKFNIPT